jgi:hypothetical protein
MSLFTDWEDFLVLARSIQKEDLFVLVSARKGATSYMGILENLPSKLEKHFAKNSRFIIYPQQYVDSISRGQYGDISAEPLSKSIEVVQKLGKGIGTIFKNKEDE